MNPMMRTLLEELTQVRARRCQYPQLGWDCLRGPVIQSSAFGRGGWVGADPVEAVLDLPGARGLFTLVVGQSAAADGVVPFEHESLLCLSVLWGLAVQRLTDTFWAAASRGGVGGSAVPCLSLSGQPSGQLWQHR